ncbi:DUF4974 domain-containing protein [Arenibacter sp. 6A1]|uniref:FecR family protein n=1 Tax=Arenibacter sp. 6A1 TaxID=2720391 RepID=UPI001447C742|nr:FecR domain-containing protein [Arenibacter sp. 6A1]NKI25456.1 DUF4974 domain-containing protein [Arenibacter sp. 6A1]
MNDKFYTDKLFQKLLDNTLSNEEYEELMTIINNSDSSSIFNNSLYKHWEDINTRSVSKEKLPDSKTSFKNILNQIEQGAPTKNKETKFYAPLIKQWFGIAATLLFLVGIFSIILKDTTSDQVSIPSTPIPTSGLITLQLDNGSVETITDTNESTIRTAKGTVVGTQNGSSLHYLNNSVAEELIYNTLHIPFGKKFELLLSDGTKVTLNAGSSLKYPVQFLSGHTRKVFLKGEAFFDVAKDAKHPFIVNANDLNIQVLGTEFNLSYFPEDEEISTVLVEGSVELYKDGADKNKNTVTQLQPGQKASWNPLKNSMQVKAVDVSLYTSWMHGELICKAMPFSKLRTKLERHFNIRIENNNEALDKQIYTATFKGESLEDILEAFKEDFPFKYSREGDTITITN